MIMHTLTMPGMARSSALMTNCMDSNREISRNGRRHRSVRKARRPPVLAPGFARPARNVIAPHQRNTSGMHTNDAETHNEAVQPVPLVTEVRTHAKREPLEGQLGNKHGGKQDVQIVKQILQARLVLQ
jgi:hypothetical protein